VKLAEHIQFVCEAASFEVQAAYFHAWAQFTKNVEAHTRIVTIIFSDFDTLALYVEQRVCMVPAVRSESDRHRQDCLEDLFTLISEVVDLDFAFLLSKGELAFTRFLTLLDGLFLQSFSLKLRLQVLITLASIFTQFFGATADPEFSKRQLYERNKIKYTPMFTALALPTPELVVYLQAMVEHVAAAYSMEVKKLGADLNERLFQQIARVQLVALS
jgi:hypothetical protein